MSIFEQRTYFEIRDKKPGRNGKYEYQAADRSVSDHGQSALSSSGQSERQNRLSAVSRTRTVHRPPADRSRLENIMGRGRPAATHHFICSVSLSQSPRLRAFCRLRLWRFGFKRRLSGRVVGVHQQCLPLGIQNFQAICSNIAYFRVSTNWSLI
jgi:hypothetical protein